MRSARAVELKFLPEDFLKKDLWGTSIELSEGFGDRVGCAVDAASHRVSPRVPHGIKNIRGKTGSQCLSIASRKRK